MAKAKARIWDLLINGLVSSIFFPSRRRIGLFRVVGMEIGAGARIRSKVWIDSKRLSVGAESFINHDCRISNLSAHVSIGDRVALASGVLITTEDHESSDPKRRQGPIISSSVAIGNGAWIGANATVLPGVTVGEGCIIAAGAVVTTNCAPHGLYAGVPATRKKDLPTDSSSETTLRQARFVANSLLDDTTDESR